jgi:hypothetical protein
LAVGRDESAARKRWAEVFGFRDEDAPAAGTIGALIERFLEEELKRKVPSKGEMRPKYAERTRNEYERILGKLKLLYGERKFARSEAEAALGGFFRTMDVSKHLRDAEAAGKPVQGNRDAAALSSVFRYAKECGETEYNPCHGAQRNFEEPRDQDLDDDLFLELYEEASDILQCLMDLDVMIGSRQSDLRLITEADWKPGGLMACPRKRKRTQAKKKQLFRRTPDLEEVIARAQAIKERKLSEGTENGKPATGSVFLFVSGPKGQPYTISAIQSMIRRMKERVARKRLAAQGIAEPTPEQVRNAVRAIDIHFHDGRARAIGDAKASGQDASDFAAHTSPVTARRIYDRQVKVLTPNPKIRRRKA